MSSDDFEKIKNEKAELLAQLEEAKLAYQKSLDDLDRQKDAVEQAALNYRLLVNKVEADLHEVPEELRKLWEAEDRASRAAQERNQAVDAIQEGLSQVGKGFTALGNKLGDTFEKFGESIRNFSEDQGTERRETTVKNDEPRPQPDQGEGNRRIVIELEEPKRAGVIKPPCQDEEPHK